VVRGPGTEVREKQRGVRGVDHLALVTNMRLSWMVFFKTFGLKEPQGGW
jgi:hypothetical protein